MSGFSVPQFSQRHHCNAPQGGPSGVNSSGPPLQRGHGLRGLRVTGCTWADVARRSVLPPVRQLCAERLPCKVRALDFLRLASGHLTGEGGFAVVAHCSTFSKPWASMR